MIHLVCLALAAVVLALDPGLEIRALFLVPAVLWAPGIGWSRRLSRSESRLQLHLDAIWVSVVALVPSLLAVRAFGGGAWTLLAMSTVWAVLGTVLARGHYRALATSFAPRFGVMMSFVLVAGWAFTQRDVMLRPLDGWWHAEELESLSETPIDWEPGAGWTGSEPIGWEEVGAARLRDEKGDGGSLQIAGEGRMAFALRGPIGAQLTIGEETWTIESDPTVVEDEGPVPRYLDRGVVGAVVDVVEGDLPLVVTCDEPVDVYVFPSVDAPWEVDGEGELKLVHYYQLLNIVENQRWANEINASERNVTINQPPLWSWVLAAGSLLIDDDTPGANLLLVWVLVLVACSGVRLLEVVAPNAPLPAWILPGLAAVVHGKLMLDPGSSNFPDSLYAAAFVGGIAAIRQPGFLRFAGIALIAGLLRYPGTIALTCAAFVSWGVFRELPRQKLVATWSIVGIVAGAFAVAAMLSDTFAHWLEILWFETVPEHFDNNQEAPPIWKRPPEFYLSWLRYSGFSLLLALPGLSRGARYVLGSAFVYSLFLCTIDHFSSHYFLPGVALAAVAVGANAAPIGGPIVRHAAPVLAAAGSIWFVLNGAI
ncbi:MAG: hypothetical protein GY913_11855 [Proteobacteria bacterium]|nr:hypothetical protein [Pseudomonadota bacterium]MCP4917609.1 hypothetical protein [Pseudomonadota bacterium]